MEAAQVLVVGLRTLGCRCSLLVGCECFLLCRQRTGDMEQALSEYWRGHLGQSGVE